MMANDFTHSFSLDYDGARSKFLAAADEFACVLATCTHPSLKRPVGQDLAIDVALLARADQNGSALHSGAVRWWGADLHDCFVPVSSYWREQTTERAMTITQQAVEELASWSLSAAAR